MRELVLNWSGAHSMSEETPKGFEGKSGLFSIIHDSGIIYIGMAGAGNTVFRESKRVGKCAVLLQKHGELSKSISYDDAWEYANEHCYRYVGVVAEEIERSEQLNKLLRNGENLLIHEINKAIPLYNCKLKNKYLYDRPFKLKNNGRKPAGLETEYSAL